MCLCTMRSRWLSENTLWKWCVMPPLPLGSINTSAMLAFTAPCKETVRSGHFSLWILLWFSNLNEQGLRWELLHGFGASLWGRSVSFKVRYWEQLPFIACNVACSHSLGAPRASQHLRQLQTLETLPECPVLPLLHLQQGSSWALSHWG